MRRRTAPWSSAFGPLPRALLVGERLVAEQDGNLARSVIARGERRRLTPRFAAHAREGLADIGFYARHILERRIQERFHAASVRAIITTTIHRSVSGAIRSEEHTS